MPRNWSIVLLLVAAAVVVAIVGVLYQTGNLQLATSADGKHFKHAVVCYVVAFLCLVGANFARPRTA